MCAGDVPRECLRERGGVLVTRSALKVVEVFPSFQGEGLLAGVPQVFLRLAGCNLDCSYCDTPEARGVPPECRIWSWDGPLESVANPLSIGDVLETVSALWGPAMHSVSLTGGEPLLQADALAELLPALQEKVRGVYLETNGTLGEGLRRVLRWVDWIAMDLKLPSALRGRELVEEQADFLGQALSRRVFLKLVVEAGTPVGEVEDYCRRLLRLLPGASDVPLVLQPASVLPVRGEAPAAARDGDATGEGFAPRPAAGARPSAGEGSGLRMGVSLGRMVEVAEAAAAFFREVRVIPQLHRSWGMR